MPQNTNLPDESLFMDAKIASTPAGTNDAHNIITYRHVKIPPRSTRVNETHNGIISRHIETVFTCAGINKGHDSDHAYAYWNSTYVCQNKRYPY